METRKEQIKEAAAQQEKLQHEAELLDQDRIEAEAVLEQCVQRCAEIKKATMAALNEKAPPRPPPSHSHDGPAQPAGPPHPEEALKVRARRGRCGCGKRRSRTTWRWRQRRRI